MDTFESLNKINDMIINTISFDNIRYNQLNQEQEIELFRIYIEIFKITHSNVG